MKQWNVKEYGVLSHTLVLQTTRIQRVIDMCHEAGGGEIIIPAGDYYIGSLRLYSHIVLHLLENAKLHGSQNYLDYTDFHVPSTLRYIHDDYYRHIWNLPDYYIYGLICAFYEEDITIIGEKGSMIDGQDCYDEHGEEKFRGPMGIIFSQCQNIQLQGYTFLRSANWSHQLDSCQDVKIKNVKIIAGHDGFNLHHCQHVDISHCCLETGDDCFAGYDITQLYVHNCYVNTACNALRIGGSDIIFENCHFVGPGHYPHISENTYTTHCFFKYYAMQADEIKQEGHILIKNCQIEDIPQLISYQYGEKKLMQDSLPLRTLVFENVNIKGLSQKSIYHAQGESCQLLFKNVTLIMQEGHSKDVFLNIDEQVELILDNVCLLNGGAIQSDKKSQILMKDCVDILIRKEHK